MIQYPPRKPISRGELPLYVRYAIGNVSKPVEEVFFHINFDISCKNTEKRLLGEKTTSKVHS